MYDLVKKSIKPSKNDQEKMVKSDWMKFVCRFDWIVVRSDWLKWV